MKNILTIDYEDMSHSRIDHDFDTPPEIDRAMLSSATDDILGLLDTFGQRATFFVLGVIADSLPDLIKKISRHGHEIASHGFYHKPVYMQKSDEFKNDLQRSIRLIGEIIGKPVLGYRAPYWSITKDSLWALDIIRELNLRYDSSISPAVNFLYGIKDSPRVSYVNAGGVWEVPPSTVKIFKSTVIVGGGFYLRALPYLFTKRCITSMNRNNIPAMVYLHPHEVINHASVHKLSIKDDFILNFNKNTFRRKLIRLLSDFAFTSLEDHLCL